MGYSGYGTIWPYEHIMSNPDRSFIKNSKIKIADKVIANMDIKAEIASKRTVDDRIHSHASYQRP